MRSARCRQAQATIPKVLAPMPRPAETSKEFILLALLICESSRSAKRLPHVEEEL